MRHKFEARLSNERLRQLLRDLNLTIRGETSTDLILLCPIHKNTDSPSFNISKSPPHLYRCWNSSCDVRGDLFNLLLRLGYSESEARSIIIEGTPRDDFISLIEDLLRQQKTNVNEDWLNIDVSGFQDEDKVAGYPGLRYLESRGVEHGAYKFFGMGYSDQKKMLVIPILDEFDRPVGVVGRSIQHRRYEYSKGFDRNHTVWNLNNARRTGCKYVILTEGACLPSGSEILTDNGWINIENYSGEKIAQYNEDNSIELVYPLAYIEKQYSGNMITLSNGQKFEITTTEDHRIAMQHRKNKKYRFETALNILNDSLWLIPRVGTLDGEGVPYSDDQIRFLLAFNADGTVDIRKNGDKYLRFGFNKQRKIDRLHSILDRMNIKYSSNPVKNYKRSICFTCPQELHSLINKGKLFPKEWLTILSEYQRKLILDEMVHWDGNLVLNRNQSEFNSTVYESAKWMQTIAHTTNMVSTIREKDVEPPFSTPYTSSILWNKQFTQTLGLTKNYRKVDNEEVYCFQVPSGMFIVRSGECISVTGNCDSVYIWQAGFESVGAIFGSSISIHQLRLIANHFQEIIVFSDNDEAGWALRDSLLNSKCGLIISSVQYPNGQIKDPEGLTKDEIKGMIENRKTNIELTLEALINSK